MIGGMSFHAIGMGIGLATVLGVSAADPFSEGVRPTDPLTPAEQQKTFQLPEGFKIELVAAEPDIQKPMNMAFDAKGRLWVSMSREYPFPAPLDKPARDSIRILEDFDQNGRARKITTFVDGLNIPIGMYPYKDGVIAWSIPNIWFFRDTDGDGKADKREVLYGPFGWERDTHGNQASFRRGFDGWLYATHGYNNVSNVKARDGSEVRMHSGNTYRMAMDGGHIEQHTYGQVNPFGMCFDPAGNMYTADCHSAPIYELLRGGYYPSFGKPHDGLGFAPTLMEHSHGSTAICGALFYADDQWPEEYQNNFFVGNVMTSRVNRDTLIEHGSSKTAREEKDLVSATDPWFRPVDLQLGPDGALYIADFYNRIIGHYEVPLLHPGRDRDRARIWKLSYKQPRALPNLAKADAAGLVAAMGSPNLTQRMIAMNELLDRVGNAAVAPLVAALSSPANAYQTIHCLWALERLKALPAEALEKSAGHASRDVRTHAMRILAERKDWTPTERRLAVAGLTDPNALVRRAAADALGQHPSGANIPVLLAARRQVAAEDDHLQHTVRMALRNQLNDATGYPALNLPTLDPADAGAIADVSLGVKTPEAGAFLVNYLKQAPPAEERTAEYLRHATRYASADRLSELSDLIQQRIPDDLDQQASYFRAIQDGSAQRGQPLPEATRQWGLKLAANVLDAGASADEPWRNQPVPSRPASANPWFLQKRNSADGRGDGVFVCSLPPGGEGLTGILRSRSFTVPQRLTFFVAGHDSPPDRPAPGNNLVRLVATDGTVIRQAAAPRNDLAQRVEWDLSADAGKSAYLEIVDGDTGEAYAWIAAGRFEPAVVPLPGKDPSAISRRLKSAAEMARSLQARELAPRLQKLLTNEQAELEARAAAAQAVAFLTPSETRTALASLVGDGSISVKLQNQICTALASGDGAQSAAALAEAFKQSPTRVQLKLAQSMSGSVTGSEGLLGMIERGEAAPRLLQDPVVKSKMAALNADAVKARSEKLVANLPPAEASAQKLIEARLKSYNPAQVQPTEGVRIFFRNCAVCHQIDGQGTLVGPQLDGIGNRGLERLLEDTLDPNRNVDINFRAETIVLKDSEVVSGLPRREEGDLLIFADIAGKEISIRKADVESRRPSDISLMPSNFGDILSEAEMHHLMSYLLSKGAPAAK